MLRLFGAMACATALVACGGEEPLEEVGGAAEGAVEGAVGAVGAVGEAGGDLIGEANQEIGELEGWAEGYWTRERRAPENLEAFRPAGVTDDDWMMDPWGSPYRYTVTENRWELRSLGADRMENTTDDVVRTGVFD